MFQWLVALVLSLLPWIYLKWKQREDFWRKKGVPSTPLHPILGSLTFLQKKNPAVWMRELYQQFKPSPYVGVWVFWRPGLVVNCPELARNILVKDSDNFRNRLLSSGKRDPIGSLNLFTVNDPVWSSVRKHLTSVFTAAKLRSMHPLYHKKATNLVQRIKTDTENGVRINLRSTYSDYSTDVIGEASFGVACDATVSGRGALRSTTKDFEKYSVWRGLAWSSIFFLPELVDIFGFTFFPKSSIKYFKEVFNTIVHQRGGYDQKVAGRDLVDALVKMRQDAAKDNEEMSEDLVLAQAAIFLQGGYDTSAVTLTYCTYELAFHSEYQEKLYEELLEAKINIGDKDLDATTLAELSFLNAVVDEVLRKYPAMGWLDRIALNDYQLDDRVTIPAGTVVYVNGVGMQMDPQYFPDPEAFRPERFLPGNEVTPYTYLPFGEGPRHCIGKRFGLNTVRYALAQLALNYKFIPWPHSPKPNECKIEKRGLFLMPEDVLSVQFVPRNHS